MKITISSAIGFQSQIFGEIGVISMAAILVAKLGLLKAISGVY